MVLLRDFHLRDDDAVRHAATEQRAQTRT